MNTCILQYRVELLADGMSEISFDGSPASERSQSALDDWKLGSGRKGSQAKRLEDTNRKEERTS